MTTQKHISREASQGSVVVDKTLFGFSWMLLLAIGLMPLVEAALHRSPSITMPAAIAYFVTVASAILMRRRYSWIELVLHIYGQITIWLSLFVISLAVVLFAAGHA